MKVQGLTAFQRLCAYVFGVFLLLMIVWLVLFGVAAATGKVE